MAYTVKEVAAMSGVSVRTLHFYDETGLLKPAYYGANGCRFYEEPQLLMLQQILFYRELGFELKQIERIVGRANVEKVAALQWHRKVLQENLAQTAMGRATSTTTRTSGSTSLMASFNLRLVISDFAWGPVSPFSYRAKWLTCGPA